MVVCKCRKSTKLFCFVHKVPVCADCVSFQAHQLCVIRTYAEWVLDADYDWPPQCSLCQQKLNPEQATTRLTCLHNLHTTCLETILKSTDLRPAGHVCPACSSPIWPPKDFKDSNTGLPLKLREAVLQAGAGDALPGFNLKPSYETVPSEPAVSAQTAEMAPASSRHNFFGEIEEHAMPSAYPDSSFEDDDANTRKYRRRGPLQRQVVRHLLPLWSAGLPTLPISVEDRRHISKSSKGRAMKWLFIVITTLCLSLFVWEFVIPNHKNS